METPVQITYRNMEPSLAITARVELEAAKLEKFYDRITTCRVLLEAPHRHHRNGCHFHVRIELGLPGPDLVVSHEPRIHQPLLGARTKKLQKDQEFAPEHKDMYVAIRDAFLTARRQLQIRAKLLRHEVKAHSNGRSAAPRAGL